MNRSGTKSDPLNLAKALSYAEIGAGHRLHFANGVYTETATCTLNGEAGNPIVIQPMPGATPIIANHITANGSWLEFRNLVFRLDAWTKRDTEDEQNYPPDLPSTSGLDIYTSNVKFINCIFHDLAILGFWSQSTNSEMSGCLSFNHGWTAPDAGNGHALYTQNVAGSTRLIKDCMFFNCFGFGLTAYSAGSGANVSDFSVVGNTCFNAGVLHGGTYDNILIGTDSQIIPANNILIDQNMTYGGRFGLNFWGAGATDVTLTDNYLIGGKNGTYTALVESGNYLGGSGIGNQVFVRPNDYDSNRANITIYNQAQVDTVQVDVSSVLNVGDGYRLRSVQDYFNDWQTGTVAGDGTITVDMQASNRSVQAPVAWTAPDTTFPEFGAFVLEKAS